MAADGGGSPRPFDAANSQADMIWLDAPIGNIGETTLPTNANQSDNIDTTKSDAEPVVQVFNHEPSDLESGPAKMIDVDLTQIDDAISIVKYEPFDREMGPVNRVEIDLTKLEDYPPKIKHEPSDPEFGRINRVRIDPTYLFNNNLTVRQKFPAQAVRWKEVFPGLIEISDSEDELKPVPSNNKPPYIQTQAQDNVVNDEMPLDQPSTRTDGITVNNNHDNEGHRHQNSNTVGGLPEGGQASNENDKSVSNSATNISLGNSILRTPNSKAKRTAIDPVRARKLLAIYRAQALSRDRALTANLAGGNSASTGTKPSDPVRIVEHDVEEDSTVAIDEAENESLFVLQGSTSSHRKRRYGEVIDVENNSEQDVQEIDGSTVPDTRGKPKRKRKQKLKPVNDEELERLKERERDASLRVGLEHDNASNRKGPSYRALDQLGKCGARPDVWRGGKRSGTNSAKATNAKAVKPKPKRSSKKKKDIRDTADLGGLIAGLQNHDVLAEANANLDRTALPTSHKTNKQAYLKALLHSVPDDDRPGVRGEKTRLYRAATNFGHSVVTAHEGGWRFKGIKSTILHHQLLGASFMRERELGSGQPFGGLLADEMGFGKTVMMIITMVTNPPSRTDKAKSTLIVCSASLMLQWKRELANHANKKMFPTIIIYHGKSQIEGEGLERVLEEADVVLTTYGQVVRSFPLHQPPEHLETPEERGAWKERHWGDQRGILHKTHFHRVVLDEAQVIKNHKSHTSLACQALMAHYRWAISGTPIMNRIEEFYPYFKFLRAPFAGSYDDFRFNFCGKGDRIYTDRLHACLKQFMLRRTHVDLIFGRPIIKLPECHTKTTSLRPTKVEVSIYRAVEFRYAQAVNSVAKWGTEEQIRRVTMAMITRLRQMTAHLFLIQQVMQDMFELDDVEQLWDLVKATTPSQDLVLAIKALIANKEDDEEPDDDFLANTNNETQEYHPPSAALLSKFTDYLKTLIANSNASEFAKRSTCPRCEGPPEDPYVTTCMHVYCKECLAAMVTLAAEQDEGAKCVVCQDVFNGSEPCAGVKELNHDMGTGFDAEGNVAKKKRHRPPKDLLKWIRKDGGVLPSTKSAAVVDQIDKWLTEDPDKKIIVFSQWVMM